MKQRGRTRIPGAGGILLWGLVLVGLGHGSAPRERTSSGRAPGSPERPLATVEAPLRAGEAQGPKAYDQPDEAQAFFLRKRLPAGETLLPTERYFLARERMALMPRHSTRESRLLPSGSAGEAPDGGTLQGWTPLGPGNIGGRTRALLLHPDNVNPALPNTMYAAGVAGGVWKTTNAGATWTPLDDMMANLAVTTMAMDPTNPDVIYAGTGEIFTVSGVRGAGIFKTTNGGATWSRLASTNTSDFYYVSKIVMSPNDPQRLYAATATGVWRSTNGGSSWTVILGPSPSAHCSDLAIRTDRPTDHLFATCGIFAQAAIYRNMDAGGSGAWGSVGEVGMGRTSLAIAPSNQDVVYAMSASTVPGPGGNYLEGLHAVYRTTDGGANWFSRVRNTDPNLLNTLLLTNPHAAVCSGQGVFNQGSYDNVIAVDPLDPSRVWAGGIDLFRSDDGGLNWGMAAHWWLAQLDPGNPRYAHADQHTIVFHPSYNGTTNQTMFVGNDGGLFRADNARAVTGNNPCNPNLTAVSWTALNNNYGVTQFYYGAPYPDGNTYFGGTQDNGTVRGSNAAGPNSWSELLGGDGGAVAVDPTNTNVLYAEHFLLSIKKSTNGGATFNSAINGITESQNNFEFITPFIMDPTNPQRLWTGGTQVWRTDNGAALWAAASSVLPGSGRVSALAVTPAGGRRALVGRTSGHINVGVSSDGNAYTWSTFTQPRAGYVSSIGFHPTDPNVAYATYSTFGGTHVWKTTNGGGSWVGSDGTGATAVPDIPCHSIVVDPSDPSRLYLGTDLGVFVSLDAGASWAVENTGFANVITESLVTRGSDLFAFTHGRGAWRVSALGAALSVNDVTVLEGNAGTVNATFTVTLSPASGQTVTVNYASANGTATAPADYQATANALTFSPGQISKTVTVLVNGDTLDENDETFFLNLSGAVNATITDGSGQATIIDDDPPPSLSVNDVSVLEGDTGTVNATFTVTLSPASGRTVTVNYTTADGTATAPADYLAAAGALSFGAGETAKTVIVAVNGDTIDEADETFFLNLSGAVNATLADGTGQATIIDDDEPLPSLSINDVSVPEGNSGTTDAVFTVTLSASSTQTVSVSYATADGTATAGGGSFSNGGSITIPSSGAATPYPSTLSVTGLTGTITKVRATITGFTHTYPSDVDVLLVGPGGQKTILMSDIGGNNPVMTGVNLTFDDAGPALTSAVPVSGTYRPTDIADGIGDDVFPVPAPAGPHPVSLATFDGTSPNGTWSLFVRDDASGDLGQIAGGWSLAVSTTGGDYVDNSGTLTFAPGATSRTVTVLVNGDTAVEADETFFVNLSAASGATVADGQGQGTILNDDAIAQTRTIQFVTTASSVGEAAGPALVAVRVTTSDGLGTTTASSVGFSMANGTATGGSDYTPSTGTITFPSGAASGTVQNISVPITSDSIDEADETFTITLGSPSNATLGANATHTVTIIDDDPLPSLSVNDVSVVEGDTGITGASFTVTLTPASGRTVTVSYNTSNGTATAPADYQAAGGNLTFNAGETTRTVVIAVNGDTLDEADETFFLNLSGAVNANISDASGQATIIDDDPLPSLAIGDTAVTEGDAGTTSATFTVTLTPASGRTVTVNYATADGTATAPGDYLATAATLSFAAGETLKTLVVAVVGDVLDEPDETFSVNLSGPSNAAIGDPQGVGTILDDDGTGLDFFTVAPCRLIDTRLPDGPGPPYGGPALTPGQIRVFALAGRCGISLSARALSINIAATGAEAPGFVGLYPANENVPLISALNYRPGVTRANNAIVGLSPIGEMAVLSQQALGTVHLIVDVNGYFE